MTHLSTAQLAAALGISPQRVNELGRKKKISREPDGQWDVETVRADLNRNLDHSQPQRAGNKPINPRRSEDPDAISGNTHDVFNRARAVKETALARGAQLDLRHRQGELLERSEIEAAITQGLTSFKNHLLLFPDKVAPKVAACSDVLECRAIIYEEIRHLLITLSDITIAENKADAA